MLKKHIEMSGETQAVWADRIGISRPFLNALIKGLKRPSLSLAVRIQRLTDGAVPATSWVAEDNGAIPPAGAAPDDDASASDRSDAA